MLLLSAASFVFESVYPQLRARWRGASLGQRCFVCSRVAALLEVFESDSMTTRPNQALQRTRLGHRGCNPPIPRAGSLSLGR